MERSKSIESLAIKNSFIVVFWCVAGVFIVSMVAMFAAILSGCGHTSELTSEIVESDELSSSQRNSINMLNHISVLTQEINASKGSRLYLEQAYSSLINNTYPSAVNSRTQAQMANLLDTLEKYRMVNVKRDRIQLMIRVMEKKSFKNIKKLKFRK